jgi:hypothetical protein
VKRRNSKYFWKYKKAHWGEDQKLQAVATYVMLGSLRETCLATSIPFDTLKMWKQQEWWKELQGQIRDEDVQQLDSNLQRVVDKALKAVEDRLDSGDYQYDPKTGKAIRIPIKAHIALKVTTDLLTKQEKLREGPVKLEVEKTIDARLLKLAEEFARFSKAKTIDAISEDKPKITFEQEVVPKLSTIVPILSTTE